MSFHGIEINIHFDRPNYCKATGGAGQKYIYKYIMLMF